MQISVLDTGGSEDKASVMTEIRSTAGHIRQFTTYELRRPLEKQWSVDRITDVHIRIIARIIEEEYRHARVVTFARAPNEKIARKVQYYTHDPGRIHKRERVYVSVLARTAIRQLVDNESCRPHYLQIPHLGYFLTSCDTKHAARSADHPSTSPTPATSRTIPTALRNNF